MKRSLNNLSTIDIVPKEITKIEHRSECTPYRDAFWSEDAGGWSLAGAHLPLFTAPMSCVVDDKNYLKFDELGIIPIIPRTITLSKRLELAKQMVWIAMGLDEFENFINCTNSLGYDTYICVDIANGHMDKLISLCKSAKQKFSNLTLMTGNIANPNTYTDYAKAGIDYVRISIGSGSGCATNDITGIGHDTIELIQEIAWRKQNVASEYNKVHSRYKSVPYVIFDGGCENIRDIICALALGADYVMCGKIFAQAKEAAGEIIEKAVPHVNQIFTPAKNNCPARIVEVDDFVYRPGRMYYGMSTERAQKEMGNQIIKASEGKEMWIEIKYTLNEWVSDFVSAISSTMSYCDKKTITDFIGNVQIRRR